MKATGIVRRIDDLGRVVIPKEIRRTLRIREGDPLEIFTDRNGEVILKKYSPIGELGAFAEQFSASMHRALGHVACVSDQDTILAAAGRDAAHWQEKPLSHVAEQLIRGRRELHAGFDAEDPIAIVQEDDAEAYTAQLICPIVLEGEAIGAVMLLSQSGGVRMGDTERKVCQTAASFIAAHMQL